MFGPWLVIYGWLKQRTPHEWSGFKPQLNFITIHCAYRDIRCLGRLTVSRHIHRLHGNHRLNRPLSGQELAVYRRVVFRQR